MKYYLLRSKDQTTITHGNRVPSNYDIIKEYETPVDFDKLLKDSSLEEAKLSVRIAKFNSRLDLGNKYYSAQLNNYEKIS
jgi:hypothetical protein